MEAWHEAGEVLDGLRRDLWRKSFRSSTAPFSQLRCVDLNHSGQGFSIAHALHCHQLDPEYEHPDIFTPLHRYKPAQVPDVLARLNAFGLVAKVSLSISEPQVWQSLNQQLTAHITEKNFRVAAAPQESMTEAVLFHRTWWEVGHLANHKSFDGFRVLKVFDKVAGPTFSCKQLLVIAKGCANPHSQRPLLLFGKRPLPWFSFSVF